MPPSRPSVSVVVPVYDGVRSLDELVTRVRSTLENRAARFEIVLVNDGSRDASWEKIAALAARHPDVVGLDLLRNCGQQNALRAGVAHARYDVIVTLDDDLEQPPEEIPRLLAKLDEGHDLVFALPEQHRTARWRGLTSRLAKAIFVRLNRHGVPTSPFRAFYAELRSGFARGESPYASLDVLLNWVVRRPAAITVPYASPAGASRTGVRALYELLASGVTGLSLHPLRLVNFLGVACLLLAAGAHGMTALLFVALGLQSFALGLLGEYVGRIHFHAMAIPMGTVRNRVGSTDA